MNRTVKTICIVSLTVLSAVASRCKKDQPASTAVPEIRSTDASRSASPGHVDPVVRQKVDALTAKWNANKSVAGTIHISLNNAAGKPGETTGLGTYVYQKLDGQERIRFWTENGLRFQQTETESLVTREFVRNWVKDGVHHKYVHQPKLKRVTKMRYDPANVLHIGGPEVAAEILEAKLAQYLPNEHVSGVPVAAFETTNEEGGKARHYFDESNGVRIKYEEYGMDVKPQATITVTDIKLDQEYDDDVFEAAVPPGYEFVDETAPAAKGKPEGSSDGAAKDQK